jgi:iron complex outermembrane receptor protein
MSRTFGTATFARHRRTMTGSTAILLALAATQPAFGQATADAARDAEAQDNIIVVTAQKRAQRAQDVPIALTAFGGEAIEQLGALDFADLADVTPGLAVTGGSDAFARTYIRGIGTNDTGIGAEPSVGVYVDGVYAARIGGALTDLVDIDRVEVLKGPQGTLFGRNSIAGAISVITNKPEDYINGMIGVEYASFDTVRVRGMINVPIAGDKFILRASGSYMKSDGWQRNIINNGPGDTRDRYTVMLKALVRPADNVEVTLSSMFSSADEVTLYADNLVAAPPFGTSADPLTKITTDRLTVNGGVDIFGNPANNIAPTIPVFNRDLQQHSLNLEWEISPSLTLTSLTAYRAFDTSSARDYDGTQFYVGANEGSRDRNETFSQEIRLSGTSDALDWFIGGSYADERNRLDFTIGLFDFGPFLLGTRINGGRPFFEVGKSEAGMESYAAFGDAIWHVNDQFNVTFGARWSHDQKYIQFQNPNNIPGVTGAVGLGGFGFVQATAAQFVNANGVSDPSQQRREGSWSDFSPRLVVDYKINPDVMIYAGVTRGYKSGGFNSTPSPITTPGSPLFLRVTPAQTDPVRPETATNFEGGIKAHLFDRMLTLNLSAFYVNFKDLQVQQVVGTVNQITNAGKASNRGIEFDLRLEPVEGLALMANGTWMDARYDRYFRGAVDLSGSPLIFSPDFAGSVAASYTLDLGGAGNLELYGNYAYMGDYLIFECVFHDHLATDSMSIWPAIP